MAKKQHQAQLSFAGTQCLCGRCGAPCRVDPIPGSKATILKRSDLPQGLCINCAVHDTLRNLYPANLILARSGPKGLSLPDLQQQFFTIARMAGTDAKFDEIDWQAIIANWDLPFPSKLKRTATNPVTEEELAMARLEGEQRRAGTWKEPLTEKDYQTQRQAAIDSFLRAVHKERHEDPPANHSDGG